MQPVIGHETNSNLSYGRWQMASGITREIIVKGVMLELKSIVNNFTIGEYGSADVPQIILQDGGDLICPEKNGLRIRLYSQMKVEGSTKYSTHPRYEIQTGIEQFKMDEHQRYVVQMYSSKFDLSNYSVRYSPSALKFFATWLEHGIDAREIYREDLSEDVLDWLAAAYMWRCNPIALKQCYPSSLAIHKLICMEFCSRYNARFTDDEDWYTTVKNVFRTNIANDMKSIQYMSNEEVFKYLWLTNPMVPSSDDQRMDLYMCLVRECDS